MTSDRADVLIVGAGPAGSIAAKHLSAAGLSVVCLEQGHEPEVVNYPGARPEWELTTLKQWHADPNVRQRPADYPVNSSNSDINPLMFAGVGGTATLYGAHWMPFLPSDFRVKTLDGVGDDWPFSYDDLLPSLIDVEKEFGISGYAGDPAYPPRAGYPHPVLPIGRMGRKAAEGFDRLGWHWWPGSNAIASQPNNGLSPCVRRGTCVNGCPDHAKSTTDITHWPEARSTGAKLLTGARVRHIEVDHRGLATGAVYYDQAGREHRQGAKVVILCANGIGTPRILLLSESARFPDGLGNSSGLVGKRLMMHPFARVRGVFAEPMHTWRGPAGQSIYSLEFYESDPRRGFVRGAKWGLVPSGGPLSVSPLFGSHAAVERPTKIEDDWGLEQNEIVARRVGRSMIWCVIGEDLPEEHNRVTLDSGLKDSDGIPAPRIAYKTSENSIRLRDFHVARCIEAVWAAGAIEVSSVVADCGHMLGTCCMGDDPAKSVVDQWGRSHDVPNLFVFDASTFPTSAGMNPTATLAAVALRSTRHLISERRSQQVPN